MMLYCRSLTIPANTEKKNARYIYIEVHEDVITRIDIMFPPGNMCQTPISVWYGSEQIAPYRKYEWVRGDDETVPFYPYWTLPEKPARIRVKGYNMDPNHEHTVFIRVEALPKELALWQYSMAAMARYLAALLDFLTGMRTVGVR